jgi:hypothetical protein
MSDSTTPASEMLTVDQLPRLQAGERGGPRYVQVAARKPELCVVCEQTIHTGTVHAYDRKRRFGAGPDRYCAACWNAKPRAQVMR